MPALVGMLLKEKESMFHPPSQMRLKIELWILFTYKAIKLLTTLSFPQTRKSLYLFFIIVSSYITDCMHSTCYRYGTGLLVLQIAYEETETSADMTSVSRGKENAKVAKVLTL